MQTYAHTKEGQKTELVTAKKKVAYVKIHHHHQKKVKKTSHVKTIIPTAVKIEIVRKIIREHLTDLRKESVKTGIPTTVFIGVIAAESTGNETAIGTDGKGSLGLGQTRKTADKATGVECNSFNPACSIKKMAAYLLHLETVEKIIGLPSQLLAYNRGPTGFKKFKGDPENDSYVKTVKSYILLARIELQG